jgi:dynein heavy chain
VRDEIALILSENMAVIQDTLKIYRRYEYLFQEKEKVEEWYHAPHSISEYEAQLRKYRALYAELFEQLPFYIRMNMVLINAVDIKRSLLECINRVCHSLVRNVYEQIKKNNELISKRVDSIDETIRALPDTTEKLVILENYIERVKRTDYKKIKDEFADLTKWLYFCYGSGYNFLKTEEFRTIYLTALSVYNLPQKIDENEIKIGKERELLERNLKLQKEDFERKMNVKADRIEEIKAMQVLYSNFKEKRKEMKEHSEEISKLIAEMHQINTKEEHLGWSPSEFPRLINAQTILRPHEDLWNIIYEYEQLKTDMRKELVKNMRPDDIEQTLKKMETETKKINEDIRLTAGKASSNSNDPGSVCKGALEYIQESRRMVPLIRVFANPGLKERHWQEFAIKHASLGKPNELKFSSINNTSMLEELSFLEEISEKATKEWNIEKTRYKMVEEWQKVEVELKMHKDTETYIITGSCVDEIEALLEDQIVKLITMKGSPHSKIFEAEINEWESFLKYTSSLFATWTKLQGMWMYLEPVFTSPDISKQLPKDHTEFKTVDTSWRSIMAKVTTQPKVLEFTKSNKKMLDNFTEGCKKLESVQKSLNDYLESKRMSFPRFFFLSNEELLEILNETKDPNKVQPHLKKCFEGIEKLKIDDEKKIHGMYSSESEYVAFTTIVDTVVARGNVDEWLIEVEASMIEAIKNETESAFRDYREQTKEKWVMNRCGMAVLTLDMTYWTSDTEAAIESAGVKGLKTFFEKVKENLAKVVRLVRQSISPLNRCTLEALIVLDVHNREVTKHLIAKGTDRINDFEWQAQLRYYWKEDMTVRIINAVCAYNYEYLGNSSRLVITQLTDRCYRTLCGALHLNYGGAPEGPAGTGKTETVKDLAKALARHCVVFNCSDGLDYRAMGKFFKGIASSGSWSCFDEFNRINLEVLSVVAQQILTIQLARGKGLTKFSF